MAAGFNTERDLVNVLQKRLPASSIMPFFSGRLELNVFSEIVVGNIIPDLLLVARSAHRPRPMGLARLTCLQSAILNELLEAGPMASAAVAERLFEREQRTRQQLELLVRYGLARQMSREVYDIRKASFPSDHVVVAIEAKLTDWRRALEQAVTYFQFAHRSYVALPNALAEGKDAVVAACRDAGVGLMGVGTDSVSVVFTPEPRIPCSSDYLWLISKCLRACVRDKSVADDDGLDWADQPLESVFA